MVKGQTFDPHPASWRAQIAIIFEMPTRLNKGQKARRRNNDHKTNPAKTIKEYKTSLANLYHTCEYAS